MNDEPANGESQPQREHSTATRWLWTCLLALACNQAHELDIYTKEQHNVIHGIDNRLEYFEIADDAQRAVLESSLVAFITRPNAEHLANGRADSIPTWGEAESLCEDEPYADQPAAAFCSGVLVDADLVLTAYHCVQDAPLGEWLIAFNYFYRGPDQIGLEQQDLFAPASIAASATSDDAADSQTDFAWIRLEEPVPPSRTPVRLRRDPDRLQPGQPLIAIASMGGVPIKLDAGGTIHDLRSPDYDFFTADTDTFRGSSGGGAFDAQLALLGVLVRGADDFVLEPEGCKRSVRTQLATEQFTYVSRALDGLCDIDPSARLCMSPPPSTSRQHASYESGCSLVPKSHSREAFVYLLVAVGCFTHRTLRRASRVSRQRSIEQTPSQASDTQIM